MRLARWRRRIGLTQGAMARRCQVNVATIREFEQLAGGGPIDELRFLCRAYGVRLVDYLIAGGLLNLDDLKDAPGRS